jgi:hypothetical protein
VVRGNNAQYTESGALSVGKGGKYQEQGSVDLTNAKNLGNTNTTIKAAKGSTVTLGDGGAQTASLAQSFNDTLNQLISSQNNALQSSGAPAQIYNQPAADTGGNPAPAGTPDTASTAGTGFSWWLIGGLVLVVVAIVWLFKHK